MHRRRSQPTLSAPMSTPRGLRIWTIRYRAHNDRMRPAYVVLPSDIGPRNNPPLPLVISPHGRGQTGRANLRYWGDLPARGRFAVISPDGEGRALHLQSWGWEGQISDLARMADIAKEELPWLRVRQRGVYAFGRSMGGQETLLLLARHKRLLAGAASFDAPTDLARRYRDFPRLRNGRRLQELARREVGGTPVTHERAYARRSPLMHARAIAFSRVSLQLYWSLADEIVHDQAHHSARLFRRIKDLNPEAPVIGVSGSWAHSAGMPHNLPRALVRFGLLPPEDV
jgi:pimeloyl-ACP methyl ester carboxylesterase